MTIEDFAGACASLDWLYDMSDDHRRWSQGRDAFNALLIESRQSPLHKALWGLWIDRTNVGIELGQWGPNPTIEDAKEIVEAVQ